MQYCIHTCTPECLFLDQWSRLNDGDERRGDACNVVGVWVYMCVGVCRLTHSLQPTLATFIFYTISWGYKTKQYSDTALSSAWHRLLPVAPPPSSPPAVGGRGDHKRQQPGRHRAVGHRPAADQRDGVGGQSRAEPAEDAGGGAY